METKLRRIVLILVGVGVVGLIAAGAAYGLFFTRSARKERAFESGRRLLAENKLKEAQIQFQRTVNYDGSFAMAQYLLGHTSFLLKDYPRAYAALKQSVDLRPNYYDSNVELARLLIDARKFQDARKYAQAALQAKPNDSAAQELYAYSFAGLGDLAAAEKELDQLIEHDPGSFTAAMALTKLKLRSRNVEGAEAVLTNAAQKKPSVDMFIALGNFYSAIGRLADAEKNYKQAIALGPKEADPLYGLGTFYMLNNRRSDAEPVFQQLSAEHQEDPRHRGAAARFHFYGGEKEKGIAELQAIVAKYPDDRYNREMLLKVLVETDQKDKAMALLSDVLKKNPQDRVGRLSRGILLLRSKQVENAMIDFREVLHLEPGSSQGHYYMAVAHVTRRERGLAKQELIESIKYEPANLLARLTLVELLLQDNSTQAATELLGELPRSQADNYRVRLAKARIKFMKSDFLPAEQELTKLTEEFPKNADAFTYLGILHGTRRNWKAAQTAFEAALKLKPDDQSAVEGLANVYVVLNQAQVGESVYLKLAAANPSSSAAALGLARLRIAQRRDDDAEKGIRDFLTGTPSNIQALQMLAELRFRKQDASGAEALAQQIVKANPDDPDAYKALAVLYNSQNRPKEAMAQYREALKRRPDDPVAANNLAWLLTQTGGNIDEALALAQKSKEKNSDNGNIADTLGWIYLKKNNVPLALSEFQDAVKKDPKNQEWQYHLGLAQFRNGRVAEAQTTLGAALAGNPSYPGVAEARQILAGLGVKK